MLGRVSVETPAGAAPYDGPAAHPEETSMTADLAVDQRRVELAFGRGRLGQPAEEADQGHRRQSRRA